MSDFQKEDPLCHVGAYFCDDENVKHSLDTIIEHAVKMNTESLINTLRKIKKITVVVNELCIKLNIRMLCITFDQTLLINTKKRLL